MWETRILNLLKWIRQRLLKSMIFIRFPASKSSIIVNYSTQKALLHDDGIQLILVWKYSVTTLWGFNQWNLAKKIQNGTSNFRIFVKHGSPRHRKNLVFQLRLSILLKKLLKFLNLLFICITVLSWPCLSTNSLTNKAEGCLNVCFLILQIPVLTNFLFLQVFLFLPNI